MKTCADAFFQCLFPSLVVDYVNCASPYNKVCECNCVVHVLVLVPGNNMSCTRAPVYEAVDDPDVILITETQDFIFVSTGE